MIIFENGRQTISLAPFITRRDIYLTYIIHIYRTIIFLHLALKQEGVCDCIFRRPSTPENRNVRHSPRIYIVKIHTVKCVYIWLYVRSASLYTKNIPIIQTTHQLPPQTFRDYTNVCVIIVLKGHQRDLC